MGNKNDQPSTFERGRASERLAEQFLLALGYHVVERNFKWRRGEIDLVMEASGRIGIPDIVFVEVRSSTDGRNERLLYSITKKKQRHLVQSAHIFFGRRARFRGRAFRFDVVWIASGGIEHWPNVDLS